MQTYRQHIHTHAVFRGGCCCVLVFVVWLISVAFSVPRIRETQVPRVRIMGFSGEEIYGKNEASDCLAEEPVAASYLICTCPYVCS